jgi:predicted dehydrogenase
LTDDRVRIALIGCGAIAEYGHAAAFGALSDHCLVTAVVDVDQPRREKLGTLLEVPDSARHAYTELLLRDGPPFDLAVVVLPPAWAGTVVGDLVEAGMSVLCEKPMDGSAASVRKIAATAASNRLGVVHNYSYRSDVREAMAHLRGQTVGTPRFLRLERPDATHFAGAGANPDWRRTGPTPGCLLDNAYHWIYLAEELAGAPIRAVTARLAADDLALLTLDHVGGALSSVQTAWCAPDATPVIEVHGTAGSLRLTGDCGECLSTTPSPAPAADREPAYTAMYRDILTAVRADRPFGASAERCAEVLDVIEAAELSAREDRTIRLARSDAHDDREFARD